MLSWIGLAGCAWISSDEHEARLAGDCEQAWSVDADGDAHGDVGGALTTACAAPQGYGPPDDCDDADALVFPGAAERCDEHDEDCDGTDDDDPVDGTDTFDDADGDGFGDPASRVRRCDPGEALLVGGDCDDTDSEVNPDAAEVCDSADNDCDGAADEDDAVDAGTWYVDTDGDGFGEETSGITRCVQPADTTAVGGDCDETSDAIHPGTTDLCDGVDDNCSGDEGDAPGARTYFADVDEDSYGDPDSTVGACPDFVPAGYVPNDRDCDDARGDVNPSIEAEVCDNGVDDNCNGEPDQCSFADPFTYDGRVLPYVVDATGFTEGQGTSIAVADITGDGKADLMVGAPYWGGSGEVFVYAGLISPTTPSVETFRLIGEDASDMTGSSVAADGDVDGDGHPDVLVSAPGAGDDDAGAAYLVYGGALGASMDLSLADAKFVGEAAGDALSFRNVAQSGGATLSGDVDGDGLDDIVLGARSNDAGGVDAGAVYVVSNPSGTLFMADAEARLIGEVTNDCAGETVALLRDDPDIGDGYADIAVGAPCADNSAGRVYILHGSTTIADLSLVSADAVWTGPSVGSLAGFALSGLGDVTGDGAPDLAVGGYIDTAWLVDTTATGASPLAGAGVTLIDGGYYDNSSFSGNADLNADGYLDLVVTETGGSGPRMYYGPVTPGTYLHTDADVTAVEVGNLVTTGDISGDGIADLLTLGVQVDGSNRFQVIFAYYGGGY